MTATEYVILVDSQDREIGLEEKLLAHQKNLLHRAFSVFIFKSPERREILMQQRALSKYHSPGLWTNTCCSHPRAGEDIVKAGQRRLQEELGFEAKLDDLGWFQYQADFPNGLHEHEVDHVLAGIISKDSKIVPNPEEVNAIKWMTIEELREELRKHPAQFTPWLQKALDIVVTWK